MNPIGIISMQFARPFGTKQLGLLPRIKAMGFDFIELLVPEAGEVDLSAMRRALDGEGLDVVLAARVNLERNLVGDDPASRRSAIDYLVASAECASTLRAAIVGGPLYGSPLVFAGRAPSIVDDELRARREDRCVEGLRAVADQMRGTGVRLAVEPLNRFETDFLNTTRQGVALVDAVEADEIGLLLDTFHMAMEEDDVVEAIHTAGHRLVHFQANENHRGFLGTGQLPWPAIFRALGREGYAGPISMEPFRRTDDRLGVPLAQWRPPSGDETAKLVAAARLLRSLTHLAS